MSQSLASTSQADVTDSIIFPPGDIYSDEPPLESDLQQLEVYRREVAQLKLIATLLADDEITSPLLPGFRVQVQRFFC